MPSHAIALDETVLKAASNASASREQDAPADLRVGSVVKFYRNKRGLSQAALSTASGHKTPEWIGMIEANVRGLDLEKVPAIAEALGIETRDLLRIAMFEYYPKAANAMYPDETPEVPGMAESLPGVRLLPETLAHARKFESLPREQAQLIIQMTDALLGQGNSGKARPGAPVHVNRSSK